MASGSIIRPLEQDWLAQHQYNVTGYVGYHFNMQHGCSVGWHIKTWHEFGRCTSYSRYL